MSERCERTERITDERLAQIVNETHWPLTIVEQRRVALELRQRRQADKPKPQELYGPGRCQICGWPLEKSMEDGCIAESCSYRPREGSEEWYELKDRREWLNSLSTPERTEP